MEVKIRQIAKEFYKGVRPFRGWALVGVILFFLSSVVNVFIPVFYKKFFDTLVGVGDKLTISDKLVGIIVIIGLINLADWFFWRFGNFLIINLEAKVMARLKQTAFDYLFGHSYDFFTNNFAGSLVQKVNRFSRSFERLVDSLVYNFIPLIVTVIGAIIVTSFISPVIVVIIIAWVIFFSSFGYFFYRWKMKYDISAAAADSHTTSVLADSITNNSTILLFNGRQTESDRFSEAVGDQTKKTIKTWNLGNFAEVIQMFVVYCVEFIVFYVAIKYWKIGMFSIGSFVLIQTYVIDLSRQIWGISRIIRTVYESLADSKEIVEIMLLPHGIEDIPKAKVLKVEQGEILFKNVSFYFNETRSVLNKVNCLISPGEKVALVGPSGAGKTTLVRLVLRLHDLCGGGIFIDKQNINKVTQESLREFISLVPQDPILFHRSLMDNIRYGHREATDAEVVEAAKLAHCSEFIDELPQGYETFVGERGIKLSGGERQRVAIARAILKNAPILILDEATSSLDSYSESLIQDALDNLMRGRTTVVIAHRLSTIRKMDRILVMENGRIIEEGSHKELVKHDKGIYKKLWSLQVSGFIH
jgi:ATP-binding cassette subfamily B protein